MLDDGEPQAGAAGGPERAGSTRQKRSKMRSLSLSEMPMPWSVTASSIMSPPGAPTRRAAMPTRVRAGE